ncbi:MAG: hypothetical protein M3285_02450 [Actinomycetota bacterium]|nr:hypothetical protein [Actinomycetota bacterium]
MQTLQQHPEKHVFGVVDRSEEVEEILEDVVRHYGGKTRFKSSTTTAPWVVDEPEG